MLRKDRYQYVLDYFRQEMPRVTTELEFGSAFQLLVATLLSAQCTDKRINMVTPALFARYPDARSMAAATVDEVYELIRSVSYPNAKAKHLVEMSCQLVERFNGEVPESAAEPCWGRAQDRQCDSCRVVWQGHHGSRYACLSCQPSHGVGACHGRQSAKGRRLSDG